MSGDGTVEGVRRNNLSRVVRLVHREGPLSRAVLTDATGLNRSTIGALVAELASAGLVIETAPDASRRVGRPSPNVSAAPEIVVIAVNPEVDALTIAAIGLDRRIAARARIEVDVILTPDRTVELVSDQLTAWRADELQHSRVVGIGIAVPGPVRSSDGLVRRAPHLGWRDSALRDEVERATGIPTVADNDATLGVLAEHLYGAAQGVDDVIYLNGGASGIGGGLVIGGRLVRGSGGYAGEFGHNRPGVQSLSDRRSGPAGVLEDEVNRARLLALVGLRGADEPSLAAALTASTHADVAEEIQRQRRILATALANAVNVLNPSVIVLGGFLATLAEQDAAGLLAQVSEQTTAGSADGLEIRPAALAENRLLVGAAEFAFRTLLDDPLSFAAAPSSLAG